MTGFTSSVPSWLVVAALAGYLLLVVFGALAVGRLLARRRRELDADLDEIRARAQLGYLTGSGRDVGAPGRMDNEAAS